MNSRMSVEDMSDQLSSFVSNGMTFIQTLNHVYDRFYNEGVFKDMSAILQFPNGAADGIIVLDWRYETMLGWSVLQGPGRPSYSMFHTFSEVGYGYVAPSEYGNIGSEDMGESPLQVDIATEGNIKFVIYDPSDVGKTVRIFGKGNFLGEENLIYSSDGSIGKSATTAFPSVTMTSTFSEIHDVQLPETMVGWSRLYVVNGGTETLLATYEPYNVRPRFRRYKVGPITSAINVFAKKRFVPFRQNTDIVDGANLGACKAGQQALVLEDALKYTEAETLWQKAVQLMTKQLKQYRGNARPNAPFLANVNANQRGVY